MISDFFIVGAGSARCVMASELIRRQAGSVCVFEAGPSERHPFVSIPFGLVWLMGSTRDWRFKTVPQKNAGTAYHPVGTLRLGGPITPQLRVKQTERLWVADASIMPQVTSANTNAPSIMIEWKGAEFIASEVA